MADAKADALSLIDRDGVQARLNARPRPGGDGQVDATLEDGGTISVPERLLSKRKGGGYEVSFAFPGKETTETSSVADAGTVEIGPDEELAVPLVEERVVVGKREVVTGKVRLTKTVSEREETVDVPLLREHTDVERVPIGRFVDEAPAIRHEGDTTIVPVLEEVLVVEKRLRLKEELRVTKHRSEERATETVTLRHEEVRAERVDTSPERD